MFNTIKLIALEAKKKSLEHQLHQLVLTTKEINADSANRLAKVNWELANVRISIAEIKNNSKKSFDCIC